MHAKSRHWSPSRASSPRSAIWHGWPARLQTTPARMVLRTAYQSPRPADWLAQRAGIPALALPYTVGGNERRKDLFGLFDDTLDQLLESGAMNLGR